MKLPMEVTVKTLKELEQNPANAICRNKITNAEPNNSKFLSERMMEYLGKTIKLTEKRDSGWITSHTGLLVWEKWMLNLMNRNGANK